MSSPRAILGPGGVGGFLTGALEHAGTPVTVVARESTAAAIAADGLSVESRRLRRFHVRPRAVASLDGGGTTLIVATKATGLRAALDRVSGAPELVVPLLNGVDPLAVLRERVAAGVGPAAGGRVG